MSDLLRREVGEEEQVSAVVHLHPDVHVSQCATQHLQHALPIGAGHLGHIAVEEAMLLIHQDVLQQGFPLLQAERPHTVSCVLLPTHRPDSSVTDILQNLRKRKWLRRDKDTSDNDAKNISATSDMLTTSHVQQLDRIYCDIQHQCHLEEIYILGTYKWLHISLLGEVEIPDFGILYLTAFNEP